jgi:glutamyl-tRNA synthetase
MSTAPRLRFAPSPTGPLHLGGARTALYNWAAARALGGRFLLRIEDTDRERSDDKWLATIFEGLRWLGIDWDEGPDVGGDFGPYTQMQRLEHYRSYADRLLASGGAYECYCTPEEIEEGRKAMAERTGRQMYDRRCRDLTADDRAARRAQGRVPSLRARLPLAGTVVLDDLCKGRIETDVAELDDWVMLRPDGIPLYNFACVVDDLEMQITHVIRGEEHTQNGLKQILLFAALDAPPPRYAHIPLILGKDGRKLSKRDAITNILDYRDRGYLADAVFNYITLLGWSFSGDRDVFTRAEMLERFRMEDIGKSGSKFDEEKLAWMAGDYLRRLSVDELAANARPYIEGSLPAGLFDRAPDYVRNVLACYQERISVLAELREKIEWVFLADLTFDEEAAAKLAKEPLAPTWLRAYADHLETLDLPPSSPSARGDIDRRFRLPSQAAAEAASVSVGGGAAWLGPKAIEADARGFVESLGIKFGQFVHPVRAALTGTTKGPGLFDCVFLLGKTTAIARLRAAAQR